jgi:outer membrane protein
MNNMRNIIAASTAVLVLSLVGLNAQAQKKFGHLNTVEIIKLMPETGKADTTLSKYAKELETELSTMYKDFETKRKEYIEKQAERSAALNQVKENELMDLQQRIQNTEQAFQQELAEKQEKLMAPILEKLDKAVKEVAKEMGINYVFDSSKGVVLVVDDTDNITAAVKKKLNLK